MLWCIHRVDIHIVDILSVVTFMFWERTYLFWLCLDFCIKFIYPYFGVCFESRLLLKMLNLGNFTLTKNGVLIYLVNLLNESFLWNVVSTSRFLLLLLGNGIYTHKNSIALYICSSSGWEKEFIEGKEDS